MKKLAVKLLCMLLALALTLAAWVGVIAAVPDRMQGTIAATMHTKVDLLQSTQGQGPRILFAGGSSSPYGTVCQTVADATGYTALDVGATAYLGLAYYLNLLDQYAQAGDVVVLAPEHMMLAAECVDYKLVWQAAGNDLDVWATVPLDYLPGLLSNSDDYFKMRWETRNNELETYHGQFGPLGDVTAYRTPLLESGWNTQDPVYLRPGGWSQENVNAINRFAQKMERRGVQVYFAFAPLDQAAVQTTAEEVDAYAASLTDALAVPVILTQQQAILPAGYFYDSNNHLTSEGADLYTADLIAGLQAQGVGAA